VIQTRKAILARVAARRSAQVARARVYAEDLIEFALTDEGTGRPMVNAPHHSEWQEHYRQAKHAVLIAPIEHGKSISVVGKTLHALGTDSSKRIAIVSNTADQAQKMLASVRRQIEENARLREVFPDLKRSTKAGDPWHQGAITVERQTIARDPSVQTFGTYGPIVGSRLDLIILDDVLDFENTRTELQRKKLIEWVDTTVLTRLTRRGQLIVVGTPWHPDDLLHVLEKRPGFVTKRYSAVENPDDPRDRWKPIWTAQWPLDRLLERWNNTEEGVFARKYLCRVRLDATARFKLEWLERAVWLGRGRSFTADAPFAQGNVRRLPCFVGVDLGPGQGDAGALTVIFTIAALDDGRRMVCNIESGHWSGPDIVDRLESHYRRYDAQIMVESNAAQVFLTQFARERIPVQAFFTGSNKWDEEWGVESLAVEFRNMQWVIPSGESGSTPHPEARAFLREALYYDPSHHTGDRLMAAWLARECLRKNMGAKSGRFETLMR
jgi:hypothetical protein